MTDDETENGEALDRMFDVLGDEHRRRVLVHVHGRGSSGGGAVDVDDVATEDEETERLRASLHHVHLPKLAAAGYVEWDAERGVVRPGENFDEIAPLVRLLCEHRDDLPDRVFSDAVSW